MSATPPSPKIAQQERWSLADALAALRAHDPAFPAAPVERLGGGIEFEVFRIGGAEPVVLKFPTERWVFNDNDQGLDNFQLLAQENALLEFSRAHGIPVPRVKACLAPAAGPHVLVLEAVETDESSPDEQELGRIVRRLHDLRPPDIDTVAQRGRIASEVVAALTVERLAVMERFGGPLAGRPAVSQLQAMLGPVDVDARLLHMDLRGANYLCGGGRLLGLIDWSNALIANPLLELARIAEYGGLSVDFTRGYGLDRARMETLDGPHGLSCRLYTAAMLAVVFLSEAPDPALAASSVGRVKELLAKLGEFAG